MIKVSICCITYNHAPFIQKCLDGFLMQECNFDYEILIYDDASTDGTSDIIRDYQKRFPEIIKPMIQSENQYSKGKRGLNAIYNFPRATGQYIALCEGDDYWIDPQKLQKQVDFLDRNLSIVVCFHNRMVCGFDGVVRPEPFNKESALKSVSIISQKNMMDTYMPILTIMFRQKVVDRYLRIDSSDVFGGDIFLKAFLSTEGEAAYLNFYGAVYRKHSGGVFTSLSSTIIKSYKAIETRLLILERVPNIFAKSVYVSILKHYFAIFLEHIKSFHLLRALGSSFYMVKYLLLAIFSGS